MAGTQTTFSVAKVQPQIVTLCLWRWFRVLGSGFAGPPPPGAPWPLAVQAGWLLNFVILGSDFRPPHQGPPGPRAPRAKGPPGQGPPGPRACRAKGPPAKGPPGQGAQGPPGPSKGLQAKGLPGQGPPGPRAPRAKAPPAQGPPEAKGPRKGKPRPRPPRAPWPKVPRAKGQAKVPGPRPSRARNRSEKCDFLVVKSMLN